VKVYKVTFEGINPVGNCLVIAAENKIDALFMAKSNITWGKVVIDDIVEVDISKPCVIEFLSGDY
tara:strand:- start:9203 stop:9397 length:195 start_codon:yes stop_codon:yes gene_type:complete